MKAVELLFFRCKKSLQLIFAFILCVGSMGQSVAGGVSCTKPAGTFDPKCLPAVNKLYSTCESASSNGVVTASMVKAGANLGTANAQAGGAAIGAAGTANTTTGLIATNCSADLQNALSACQVSIPSNLAIKTFLEKLGKECIGLEVSAADAQGKLTTAKGAFDAIGGNNSSSGMMGWLVPGLIGAGLGAAAGSLFGGGDDDSSSSKESKESPPSLAEAPAAEAPQETKASGNSSVAVSQASEGISQPAIVVVPTVEPGTEAGSGDDEILIAASGAIPDPDSASSDSSASSNDSTTGGTTTIGGTTGSDGTRDTDVADASTNSGDSSSVSVVDDDETVVGLVSGSSGVNNRGLATQNDNGAAQSSSLATGSGSGMLKGLPVSRRGSASKNLASQNSSRGQGKEKSNAATSSRAPAQTEQRKKLLVDDLVSRGLIGNSSSSAPIRRQ